MDLGSILRLFFNCDRRGYAVMKAATPNFTSLMDFSSVCNLAESRKF